MNEINIANDKKIVNANFKAYDGSKLPFDDNQFDDFPHFEIREKK